MPIDDIVFTDGDAQNSILEIPLGTLQSPTDILCESGSNQSALCLETTSTAVTTSPEILMLSDGKLAKRISNSFYLKLP